MTLSPGEEFNIKATPSQALQRKLLYLAAQDNDSILTGAMTSPRHVGESARSGKADRLAETVQLLSMQEQIRQQRIDALTERLDALDRASLEALRKAEERLEEIRRTANRTIDGRLAFEGEDGKIRDEHGNEISPDEIDQAAWDPDAEKFEAFREAQQQRREAMQVRTKVQEYRERLEGGDPSDEDLDDLDKEITKLEAAMTGHDVAEQEQTASARSTSAAKQYAGDDAVPNGATLREPFAGAVIPADADPAANSRPVVPQPARSSFTPG